MWLVLYLVVFGVDCVVLNELFKFGIWDCYVVVGVGKIGMDVCLWLF